MPVWNPTPAGGGSLGYTTYVAIMTQSGVAAPSVTVIQNTIGAIAWSRVSAGEYLGIRVGAFPSLKTFLLSGAPGDFSGSNPDASLVEFLRVDANTVRINTLSIIAMVLGDDLMQNQTTFEIRVYP